MTLGKLIDLASDMEKQAYTFYESLETQFKDKKEFVACIGGIKADELLHLQVLTEIKASLSDYRLSSLVSAEAVERIERALQFTRDVDVSKLKTVDQVCAAIQKLEEVEFDVVMSFVQADEINFEFTREYLQNESLDHSNRVYLAQQSFE